LEESTGVFAHAVEVIEEGSRLSLRDELAVKHLLVALVPEEPRLSLIV